MKRREIRFRAWDGENMKLSPRSSEGLHHLGTWFEAHSTAWLDGKKQDNVVMQWTGLKDKNGKEIYEGDWVSDGPNRTWEVMWRSAPAGFGLFLYERGKKPFDGRLGRLTTSLMDYQCEKLEVVGNIYQNLRRTRKSA